jgi:hypothetical protein
MDAFRNLASSALGQCANERCSRSRIGFSMTGPSPASKWNGNPIAEEVAKISKDDGSIDASASSGYRNFSSELRLCRSRSGNAFSNRTVFGHIASGPHEPNRSAVHRLDLAPGQSEKWADMNH